MSLEKELKELQIEVESRKAVEVALFEQEEKRKAESRHRLYMTTALISVIGFFSSVGKAILDFFKITLN